MANPTVRRVGNYQYEPVFGAPLPPAVDLSGLVADPAQTALKLAIDHIEHMAAFIVSLNAGYSFEALGEDMATIKAGLKAAPSTPGTENAGE